MKICQTVKRLTKDGQRGTILKLVISPPNLLKQEKFCLIPPEAEHQSTALHGWPHLFLPST